MDKSIAVAPTNATRRERTLAVYPQASGEGRGRRDCTELPAYGSGQKS
jgi:hypothetical protein